MDAMTGGVSKRAAQGRATREQLIEVATRLFAERGYEDTSVEAVLAATGVSRGALYHHFAGKDDLFSAVAESVNNRILADLAAATSGMADPFSVLQAASLAWVDMAGDPVIERIILTDGPSVLGLERWRAMDEQRSVAAIRAMLQAISDSGGDLPAELVDSFAHMILGALDEIAMVIARAGDKEAATADGRAAVRELLRRLLTRG